MYFCNMRGKQVLYDNIFPTSLESAAKPDLKERRDDKLAARFYFYAHICRYRYEKCLTNLEHEFDISHTQIIKRLSLRTDYIKDLVNQGTTTKELSRLFPYYNWTVMRLA